RSSVTQQPKPALENKGEKGDADRSGAPACPTGPASGGSNVITRLGLPRRPGPTSPSARFSGYNTRQPRRPRLPPSGTPALREMPGDVSVGRAIRILGALP